MIQTFGDKHTRDFFIKGKSRYLPPEILKRALRKLEYLHLAKNLEDLRVPPSNRLHLLSGDLQGQYAISINDQWRICFRFENGGAYDVVILDYH